MTRLKLFDEGGRGEECVCEVDTGDALHEVLSDFKIPAVELVCTHV